MEADDDFLEGQEAVPVRVHDAEEVAGVVSYVAVLKHSKNRATEVKRIFLIRSIRKYIYFIRNSVLDDLT